MTRRVLVCLLLAAGCTPAPALVPPPGAACRSWVLPPPPPAPVPLSAEERQRLEAEWPPVWVAAVEPPPQARRVVPRVRLVHPPVGAAPRSALVLQARARPEVVVLRADGCEPRPCAAGPCPDARPVLREAHIGGCPGSTPTPPGR